MADLISRLQNLKKQKAEAEQAVNRLQGKKELLLKQLKTEFDCDSEDEAKAKLDSLQKDIQKREERAERLLSELEEVVNG